MITWLRQPAQRNRRPETLSASPASQPLRRRTPSSAGYSSCIRAQHGVGHGVDTELAGCDRRRAYPKVWQALAAMSSPSPDPLLVQARPSVSLTCLHHPNNGLARLSLGGRDWPLAPSKRGLRTPPTGWGRITISARSRISAREP